MSKGELDEKFHRPKHHVKRKSFFFLFEEMNLALLHRRRSIFLGIWAFSFHNSVAYVQYYRLSVIEIAVWTYEFTKIFYKIKKYPFIEQRIFSY